MKRLVLAPHCDDETLGCGGLLAKHPDECGVVVVSAPDEVRRKEFEVAKDILGWEPKVKLREGLQRTLDEAGVEALVGVTI